MQTKGVKFSNGSSMTAGEIFQRQINMFGDTKDSILRNFDEMADIYGKGMQVLGRLSDIQERIDLSSMTPAEKEESRRAINIVKMLLAERIIETDEVGRML